MYISLIGPSGSGKTTLFHALTGSRTHSGTSAVIDVPDERLEILAGIFKPKKVVHARIELTDTVAIEEGDMKKDSVSPKMMQDMRKSDAFLLVLRHFDNGNPIDPVGEFQTMVNEFILSDMVQIETRIERIHKQGSKKDSPALQQELAALDACCAHVNDGQPLCTLPSLKECDKELRGFQFLSQKPMMVVVNCGEEDLGRVDEVMAQIKPKIPGHVPVMLACGKLEAELAFMSPEERSDFMAEYGLTESVRHRIIRMACNTLGLISFLTVGEDECRAWPIKNGMTAQEAAGTIHTDFYQKFIRAETVAYQDFIDHKGFAGCKKAGVWRLEGKTYIVQEGDIISVRAGN